MLHSIIGQRYAVTVLENALQNNRPAGSYLFVGPSGVGKTATAFQFCKMLCGITRDDDPRARAIDAGTYPDVRSVEPMGPSRIIRIGQLWPRDGDSGLRAENAMLRDLHFEPISGRKRVFIISEAEGLNESSGNSLLKTLEEPPPYAHFLLTASSTSVVLPTILSRCQIVHFSLLSAEVIEEALMTRYDVPAAQARFLATFSEGRLGRAIAMAKNPALLDGRDQLLDAARDLLTAPSIKCFKISEEFRKLAPQLKGVAEADGDLGAEKEKGVREPLVRALTLISTYYRDVLGLALNTSDSAVINIDRLPEMKRIAAKSNAANLEAGLSLLVSIRHAIERNANAQLAMDVLFTHLALPLEPAG